MSPIAYTANTKGMLSLVTDLLVLQHQHIFFHSKDIFFKVSLPEFMTEIAFLTPSTALDELTAKWCAEESKTQDICYNILFTVTG